MPKRPVTPSLLGELPQRDTSSFRGTPAQAAAASATQVRTPPPPVTAPPSPPSPDFAPPVSSSAGRLFPASWVPAGKVEEFNGPCHFIKSIEYEPAGPRKGKVKMMTTLCGVMGLPLGINLRGVRYTALAGDATCPVCRRLGRTAGQAGGVAILGAPEPDEEPAKDVDTE